MAIETPPTIAPDHIIGMTIGHYVVRHRLGEGGMGSVYLAEHPSIGKRVALKVLHAEFASQPDIVSRFFNEAKVVNDIQHPNIVDIVDFGTIPPLQPADPPLVYFLMELLQGQSLTEAITRDAPLPHERALGIACQIADALAASHNVGVVHRDLKPENVMLVSRGRERDFVKLLDFGIAKLSGNSASTHRTRTGMVIGTPQYMSPEQCEGRGQIDHRTDIYALGIVLYQMLTGRVPFVGEGFGEVLVQQMAMPPLAPSVLNPKISPHLELVVLKALEKRADNRFLRMEEMSLALQDPKGYIELHGGLDGFLATPVLRDPSVTGAGGAAAMLTSARAVMPTTLGGAAVHVTELVPRKEKKKRTGLILGVGFAVMLAGGIAVGLAMRGGGTSEPTAARDRRSDPKPDPSPDPEPSKPPVVADPPPVAADKPPVVSDKPPVVPDKPPQQPEIAKTVPITIASKPSGATVTIDGEKKGTTPYAGELERDDTPIEIKLTLPGHKPERQKIIPNEELVLSYTLARGRAVRPPPNTGRTTTTNSDDTKNPFNRLNKR